MGEILFLSHRIPFPPDRGDKIRSHHLLKALAGIAPVHVGTLGETAADFSAEPLLAEVANSHCLARRPDSLVLAGLKALAARKPVSVTAFQSSTLQNWISTTLARHPIHTIFVFSGQMGQYIPLDFKGRVVVDLCDVDSAKFEAYAQAKRGWRTWIDRREAQLLAQEENRLANRADATLLSSDAEAALFRRRTTAKQPKIMTIGNGIDTVLYDPSVVPPHPALAGSAGPQVLFTGQMDYLPNVAAAQRTAKAIMPAIRRVYPDACFHVVGRAPSVEVLALDQLNGTQVWGEVQDVRPFLAAADLVVAPLAIARGVQNKVLEAMAMARPVLLTPEASIGIDAVGGQHYTLGASDEDLIAGALALLADNAGASGMGAEARKFVLAHKSWDNALAPLASLLGFAAAEARHAA